MLRHLTLAALLCFVSFGAAVAGEAECAREAAEEETGDADEAPSLRIYETHPVVIHAARPLASAGGSSAIEVAVDSLPLPAAATAEEVLRKVPLLHVRTNSRGEAEISARGSESRQVAVLVDGVPITLAWDARADVSVIPAAALHEVTFTRGLSSMLYGPNVLGGILEARVGQADVDRPETEVTVGLDHVGRRGTTIATARPIDTDGGRWTVRAGAGYRDSPGDPLASGVTERPGGEEGLRLNTDAEDVDGFLALRYRADGGARASLSWSAFRVERGIGAEIGAPDDDARFWRYPHVSRSLAVLSAGTGRRASPLGGRGGLEASVGWDRGRTEIDAYTSAAYDVLDTFEDGKDRTLTLRLVADQTLGGKADLSGAITAADVRHTEIIPAGELEYEQRLMSVGTEAVWRPLQSKGAIDELALTVGGAYDWSETPEAGGRVPLGTTSEWGGRLGISVVTGTGRTTYHASVSRRGRFPALRELYSGALNRFLPNPDLVPEKLVTIEAGVTTRARAGEVQAVVFHHRLNDAVVRTTLQDAERHYFRVNRDRLRTTGLELLAAHRIGRVDLSGELTVQDVELTDTSAGETHEPEDLPEVFWGVEARMPLLAGAEGGARVDYTGRQFSIDVATGEDAELEGKAIVGGWVARTWRMGGPLVAGLSRLTVRLSVENAGDEALYDASGLPEPGRRFRLEARLQ
jgi:iron complex outermembrane receptor protein